MRGTSVLGHVAGDPTMGTIAREMSTETSMKGVGVRGVADNEQKLRRQPSPTYRTTMYIANSVRRDWHDWRGR